MESGTESSTIWEAEEFEYMADVKAWETFSNYLRSIGISLREGNPVTFRSSKRIDMKGMKVRGLLRSYKISKVAVSKQVIETG